MEQVINFKDIPDSVIWYREPIDFTLETKVTVDFYNREFDYVIKTYNRTKNQVVNLNKNNTTEEEVVRTYNEIILSLCVDGFKPLIEEYPYDE